MKVRSTNIARPTRIQWNGKTETTGIYKYPVDGPITLESEAVAKDIVADRRVHGGIHKACYLYSSGHYPYWKSLYPGLEWDWGMFGENLTVDGMDERHIRIGDIFRVGEALVQVSMPREPCYKLGIRFGDQQILKAFIAYGYPGTYVRVLEEGGVKAGDSLVLLEESPNPLTVHQCFELYYARIKSREVLTLALDNPALPEYKREALQKYT